MMLTYAVNNDNDLLLELLFDLDPNYTEVCRDMVDLNGNTLVHTACEKCFDRVAVFLLMYVDVNIHAVNRMGSSLLISAARGGCEQAAEIMIERGVDMELADNAGMTALMHAGSLCTLSFSKMLIAKGAILKNPFSATTST